MKKSKRYIANLEQIDKNKKLLKIKKKYDIIKTATRNRFNKWKDKERKEAKNKADECFEPTFLTRLNHSRKNNIKY